MTEPLSDDVFHAVCIRRDPNPDCMSTYLVGPLCGTLGSIALARYSVLTNHRLFRSCQSKGVFRGGSWGPCPPVGQWPQIMVTKMHQSLAFPGIKFRNFLGRVHSPSPDHTAALLRSFCGLIVVCVRVLIKTLIITILPMLLWLLS